MSADNGFEGEATANHGGELPKEAILNGVDALCAAALFRAVANGDKSRVEFLASEAWRLLSRVEDQMNGHQSNGHKTTEPDVAHAESISNRE
jgi:hypothetical protein